MIMASLIPRNFWSVPSQNIPSIFDDVDEMLSFGQASPISISEDEKNIYLETAMPGVDPDDVEVTYDRGILWVRGLARREEKDKVRKFYRRAASEFSYRIAVPGDVDLQAAPEASCENGIVTITFPKAPSTTPKKIAVKKGEQNGESTKRGRRAKGGGE